MFPGTINWKAPLIRGILVIGAFLSFFPLSFSQFTFDQNCRLAYEAVISLRFTEAQRLISTEKQAAPDNLLPVYLENYIDYLTLVIGEEQSVYNQLKNRRNERLSALESADKHSPWYRFCLGEVHLQWALARLKFGDYTGAAFEIRKAYSLFSENRLKYPAFLINNVGLGVVHVIVSLVPDNYKWLSSIVGMSGTMEAGLGEIRKVAEYDGADNITRLYKTQASFYLAFLTLNLQKNKKDAIQILNLFRNQSIGKPLLNSPLLIYARSTILMRNGFNDDALQVLHERIPSENTFNFAYLDYLEGMARLNKLDYSASSYFERFISTFRGQNYTRSAYQKLAWIAVLKGDTGMYRKLMHHVLLYGASAVDEDKQAGNEALKGMLPNVILLRARLLFDGGYYNLAIGEMLNNQVALVVRSKQDFIEYTYRMGRIYHETGNLIKAIQNYQKTILRGKTEPYYFAASAAYQMGLLYENKGDYIRADSAYQVCLSLKPPDYRTSLHQKAKAGLNRIKKMVPKT
ncbi:MAG: hypothetical protein ACOYNC_04805 [Bacteroidales bacterium]